MDDVAGVATLGIYERRRPTGGYLEAARRTVPDAIVSVGQRRRSYLRWC